MIKRLSWKIGRHREGWRGLEVEERGVLEGSGRLDDGAGLWFQFPQRYTRARRSSSSSASIASLKSSPLLSWPAIYYAVTGSRFLNLLYFLYLKIAL